MKQSTEYIYKQKINQVIDYIHSNLHQPIQLKAIADNVHVSQRQLLRMMSTELNESLYAYVARQRMERAILYMQIEEMGLQDLAMSVGYANSQSFSKAFKKQFGVSPKAYIKKLQADLDRYANEKDKCSLSPEICHFGGLTLVYIRIWGEYGEKETYGNAWGRLIRFLKSNDLLTPNTRFIGLSFDSPHVTDPAQCRFYACASITKSIHPVKDFGIIHLPPGRYAVYTLNGDYSKLGDLHLQVRQNKTYPLRFGIAFDEYLNCLNANSPDNLVTKVYVPIK